MLVGELNKYITFYSGNSGLTQQAIYANLPIDMDDKIVVLAASKYYKKEMGYIKKDTLINRKKIKVYDGESVLVVRKGAAGTMHYYSDFEYAINEDAYVIKVKDKYKDDIDLEWFSYYFQKLFFNIVTSKDGNSTFSKEYAKKQMIEIPDIKIQRKELDLFRKLKKDKDFMSKLLKQVEQHLEKIVICEHTEQYIISDLFYMDTGRRVTKKELYNIIGMSYSTQEDIITIVSSGVEDDGIFGYAPKNYLEEKYRRKQIKNQPWVQWHNYVGASYIIDEPCVTWNTDGNAGNLFYRTEIFFPTDHCGVLIPKEKYKDKINLIYFAYSQQHSFKQNLDRGNLHLEKMSTQIVDLPDINFQNEVSEILVDLIKYKDILYRETKNIEDIMKREWIS